ncbi:MAG: glycosyltransferase family 2 protein [Crocinitomicaceae bacterium]
MISIVMPVKNAAPVLKETIASILLQSTDNWELIAVDDHSTDTSFEILQHYSQEDSRVKCFRNPGRGIIDALSHAFTHSCGEFISRMDADDVMHPQKLEKLANGLQEKKEAIITSKVRYFSAQPLGGGYKKYEEWLNQRMDRQDHYEFIYKECVLPSPNWMMHRSTLSRLGGFQSLEYPEDYDLCFKAYANGIELIGLPDVLHQWRDYPERTSRNDPNYADNTFTTLKVRHFIAIDYSPHHVLCIWGAGNRGKRIAKELRKYGVNFQWITDNPKKIGHFIYEVQISASHTLENPEKTQLIIAVSNPVEQKEIDEQLQHLKMYKTYWFC